MAAGPGPKGKAIQGEWSHRKTEWERLVEAAQAAQETIAEAQAPQAVTERAAVLAPSVAILERLAAGQRVRVLSAEKELRVARAERDARALVAMAAEMQRRWIEQDEDDIEALLLAA